MTNGHQQPRTLLHGPPAPRARAPATSPGGDPSLIFTVRKTPYFTSSSTLDMPPQGWLPNVGTLSSMLLLSLYRPHPSRGLGQSSTALQNLSTFFFSLYPRPSNLPTPGALSSYGARNPPVPTSVKACSFTLPEHRQLTRTHCSSAQRPLPTALRSVSVRIPTVSPLLM